MENPNTLAPSPDQETQPMAYDEAIVANHLPYKKLNYPDGMPN